MIAPRIRINAVVTLLGWHGENRGSSRTDIARAKAVACQAMLRDPNSAHRAVRVGRLILGMRT